MSLGLVTLQTWSKAFCFVISLFPPQSREHDDFFFFDWSGNSTTLMASSKISLRPAWVRAEHSLYEMAPIFLRIASPWEGPIGRWFLTRSLSISPGLSLKSSFVPTKILGTPTITCVCVCVIVDEHITIFPRVVKSITKIKKSATFLKITFRYHSASVFTAGMQYKT